MPLLTVLSSAAFARQKEEKDKDRPFKKTYAVPSRTATGKYLRKPGKREDKPLDRIARAGGLKASQLFAGLDGKYAGRKVLLETPGKYTGVYPGHPGSITTPLNFLKGKSGPGTGVRYKVDWGSG